MTALISLGKVLGPQWEQYHHTLNRYLIYAGIIAALIFLLVYVYRRNKILFTELLTTLMISMIQEYLEKEFKLFDEVVSFIIHEVFDPSWGMWMNRFALLGSYYVFIPLIGLTMIMIVWKGKDRMHA